MEMQSIKFYNNKKSSHFCQLDFTMCIGNKMEGRPLSAVTAKGPPFSLHFTVEKKVVSKMRQLYKSCNAFSVLSSEIFNFEKNCSLSP